MTTRSPSVFLAAAIRASISSSERRRYRSGSGCRSPMLAFSTSVRILISITSCQLPVSSYQCRVSKTARSEPRTANREPRTANTTIHSLYQDRSIIRGFGAGYNVVKRVSLYRVPSGGPDQAADGRCGHRLGCSGAGHVVNILFLHGTVEVVDAEPQGYLRHLDPGGNPERFHVGNVVEHQARDGVHAQCFGRAWRWQLPHLVVVGMKCQGNEGLKPARLVLQGAGAQHVIDALFFGFDVTVEHRDVGPHPERMRDLVNREVSIRAALVVADLSPHAFSEHLRATTGQRIEPRCLQLTEHLLVGHPIQIGKECDLDGGETLEMNSGADPFESAKHVEVVVGRQFGMEAVDHMDLRQRLMRTLTQLVPGLLEGHGVGPGVAWPQTRKRAEETARDADVGGFEPDIEVVVGPSL